MLTDVKVPTFSGTNIILKHLASEGSYVSAGAPILCFSFDAIGMNTSATAELEAPVDGQVHWAVPDGSFVSWGDIVARIVNDRTE